MVSFIYIYGKGKSRYNPHRIKATLRQLDRSDNDENIFASEASCLDN